MMQIGEYVSTQTLVITLVIHQWAGAQVSLTVIMNGTKAQTLGRMAHGFGNYLIYACAPLIDGLGHATPFVTSSQASCVIVSGFRAALDLDTYPLSNIIRPRRDVRAKPGRGKPVLVMQFAFSLVFTNAFVSAKSPHYFSCLVALKPVVRE